MSVILDIISLWSKSKTRYTIRQYSTTRPISPWVGLGLDALKSN